MQRVVEEDEEHKEGTPQGKKSVLIKVIRLQVGRTISKKDLK
jgi:hypothetical protein